MRTLLLILTFAVAADAAPRTRAVAHPPAGLAITGEFTTADPVLGTSNLIEDSPRVATGGGVSLVVWNLGEKAARLDSTGRVLDPTPIAVLPRRFPTSDLVFHDGAFIFAAASHQGTGAPFDVLLVRITPAGDVSTRRIAGTAGARTNDSVALATNGRELLVAVGTREGNVETHLVASDGSATAGPRFPGEDPKVTSDGTDFLAGYHTASGAAVRRISRSGAASEPAPLALPAVQDLLWDSTDYVALGVVDNVLLRAIRVSAAGVPGAVLLEIPAGAQILNPSFSWTGSEYRLLWKQRGELIGQRTLTYDLWVARAGASGQVLESVRLRQTADAHGTHVVIGSTDIAGSLMAWSEATDTGSGTIANLFATTGIGTPIAVVSGRPNDQYQATVAQNSAATLVAFVDFRRNSSGPGTSGISIARVHPDGSRAPGPGTLLYPARTQDYPDAAWNGVDTWIVWREANGVLAARVDANGTLLDREPIRISSSILGSGPKIACGTIHCMIVRTDGTSTGPNEVRSLVIAPNGVPLAEQPRSHGPGLADDVVWTGDGYTIAIAEPGGISLARVGRGSTFIASPGAGDAAIAWSGREYLVVWRDPDHLLYTRVDAAGNILGEPRVIGRGLFPAAIWTGRHFLVAYDGSAESDTIGGLRISRGGAIVDRFPLSAGPGNHDDPALAIHDDGTIAVSYTKFGTSRRTFVRFARD